MSEVRVRTLEAGEAAHWPGGLGETATFAGLDGWSRFVSATYGTPVYRLQAERAGEVGGLLVLAYIRHRVWGNYLTTAPFASYGGFAFSSQAGRDALLAEATRMAGELKAEYANVRFAQGEMIPPGGWTQHAAYCTYLLDLAPGPEYLMASFGSDHRNHIRKSLRKGFSIRFGGPELLDDAYEALARSMHELGSPYHAKVYLQNMARSLGNSLEFAVMYGPRRELAGSGVFILHAGSATNLHANILRRFRSDYAGEFLYWSAIERYCGKQLGVFDMGRSLIGSGNETFKMKWRPRRQPLAYWYALRTGAALPELNQKNPKFRLAIWTWKRLPRPVVRLLGPSVIRGLA